LRASTDGTLHMTLEVAENGMRGDMVMYARGSDMAMSVKFAQIGMEMRMGMLDGVSWSIDPMHGPRLIEGEELAQMYLQASSERDLYAKRAIESMKTVALSDSEGRPCYRVEIRWKTGDETASCFGVEDGLALSNESTSVSLTGETREIIHFYDYRSYGPMKMPSRMRMKNSGLTHVMSIDRFELGTPAADVFALPPAIAALVEEAKRGGNDEKNREASDADENSRKRRVSDETSREQGGE
jgi:hypothetical protein